MRTFLALLLVSLAAFAVARESFVLRRVPTEGQIVTYAVKTVTTIQQETVEISQNQIERVVAVQQDGSYLVESTLANIVATIGGKQYPMREEGADVLTIAPNGQVIGLGGSNPANRLRLENLTAFVAGAEPVEVGATWSVTLEGDSLLGSLKMVANYRIVDLDDINGERAARIVFDTLEQEGSVPASGRGTVWVRLSDGLVVRLQANLSNAPILGAVGEAVLDMRLVPNSPAG